MLQVFLHNPDDYDVDDDIEDANVPIENFSTFYTDHVESANEKVNRFTFWV